MVFVDGKAFYQGSKTVYSGPGNLTLDYEELAESIKTAADGDVLVGVRWYTEDDGSAGLANFLTMLRNKPGFVTCTVPERNSSVPCRKCGTETVLRGSRELNTNMVSDVLSLAASNLYDVAVIGPAHISMRSVFTALERMGKVAYPLAWTSRDAHPFLDCSYRSIDLTSLVEDTNG